VNKLLTLLSKRGTPMVTLPQNLLTGGVPATWDDFEGSIPGTWSASTGSVAADTTNYKNGTQGLRVTTPSGNAARANRVINVDLSNCKRFSVWMYSYNALSDIASIEFWLSSTAGFTKYMSVFPTLSVLTNPTPGWHLWNFTQDQFTATGGESWSNTMIAMRFKVTANSGKTVVITFDDLRLNYVSQPAVMIHFDDGFASQYTAFQYMKAYNMRGTMNVITNLSTGITAPQLLEMYAAGWTVCNHTQAHPHLATLNLADQTASIQNGYNDLVALGITTTAKHVAYPFGEWNADTYTALGNLAMQTGRGTVWFMSGASNGRMPFLPPYEIRQVECHSIVNTMSLATVEGFVDLAITRNCILVILFHDIGVGSDQWTVADFQALIGYIRTKTLAGLIQPITIDDYYKLTLGSVAVPMVK
jgi:peptidoglycan/xylan/chitin deacetylase (PgdA/CDA1 family)